MSQLPTVAVIGAGSSGIAAVKALCERGLDVGFRLPVPHRDGVLAA